MPPPYLFHAAASGGKYAWKPVNFQAGYLRAFGFPYPSPVFLQKKTEGHRQTSLLYPDQK